MFPQDAAPLTKSKALVGDSSPEVILVAFPVSVSKE